MSSEEFKCVQCGRCCRVEGYVRLTKEDSDRMAEYLFMDVREFVDTYTRVTETRGGLSLVENDDHSCVFIEEDNTCLVNDAKPAQCRRFPVHWSFYGWEDICAGCKKESVSA